MKQVFSIVNWFMVLSLCLVNSFAGNASPADSVYFEAGWPSSENGDTLFIPSDTSGGDVTIHIMAKNEDFVAAFVVPLVENCGCALLDPAKNNEDPTPICFQGSRVVEFGSLTLNLNSNPPQVLYGAVTLASPLPPGEGLFARMIYTIPPGVSDTCICLDTLFFPPSNVLRFVDSLSVGHTPSFEGRCFQVAVGKETDVPETDFQKRYDLDLKQNYPNPFNSQTTIWFTVHGKRSTVNRPLHINLTIYNILSQKVRILLDQKKIPGRYQVVWDGKDEAGKDVASGIYLYKLSIGDFNLIKKMVLLR